jgi:ribosomal protein S18 acetylase RimI-like enzyme
VRVEEVTTVTDDLVAAFAGLVPQLSTSAEPPDAGRLTTIVSSPSTRLLAARSDNGEIVGVLTLACFDIPTGTRAWIEDVVVDEAERGAGIGAALVEEAVRLAQAAGARTIDLTSRPEREAANRLYKRTGFSRRETNVYRRVLP